MIKCECKRILDCHGGKKTCEKDAQFLLVANQGETTFPVCALCGAHSVAYGFNGVTSCRTLNYISPARKPTQDQAISEVDVNGPWPNHSEIERRYVYDKLEELKSVVGNLHDSTRWEGRKIQVKLWDIQRWVYPEYNARGRNQ